MNKRALVIAVVVFVLIVLGMYVFSHLKETELHNQLGSDDLVGSGEEVVLADISEINAKHYYDRETGRHTIAGEVLMPTPCDILETNALVLASAPEQVTVAFDVTNDSETCVQVLTPQRFKVSFPAEEDAEIVATFQRRGVDLNLTEAADGEDPADFELFIR